MTDNRISVGEKRLEWVPVDKMRVSPRAQRDHSKAGAVERIQEIATNFDPDKFGTPVVNKREGIFWVVDGGHRLGALRVLGWEDQQVQAWVYHGLTEEQEAMLFLDLNNVRPVNTLDKFRVAVTAGREPEVSVDRLVRAQGLTVGGSSQKSIQCVSALRKVYELGPDVFTDTLRVVRDSYGRPGFSAKVIEGVGLFISNYQGQYDTERLVSRLAKKFGGVNGLIGRAEQIRGSHGVNAAVAVAASTVETYNQGRGGGGKLTGWWQKIGVESTQVAS